MLAPHGSNREIAVRVLSERDGTDIWCKRLESCHHWSIFRAPRPPREAAGAGLRLRSGAAETREITLPRSISTPRHHFATRRPVMKSDLPSTFNPWIRALTTASVPRPPIRLTTQPVTFRRTRGVRSFHWPRPCVQKPCPSSSLKCILSAGVSLSLDTVLKEYASGYF
jgi:hypothetical protein